MSERTWWITMGAWTVLVLGLVAWMWWEIRQADDRIEANDAEQDELTKEMRQFNLDHKVIPLPPADIDSSYEAFLLDGADHPHPRTPPKRAA